MSDSVEGEVPRPGAAKASAERPDGKAEGGLKAEDAERFASAFVPVWQFDEAPFSAGARFSAGELEELGASSGVGSGRTIVDPPVPNVHEEPTAANIDLTDLSGATTKLATVPAELAAGVIEAAPRAVQANPAPQPARPMNAKQTMIGHPPAPQVAPAGYSVSAQAAPAPIARADATPPPAPKPRLKPPGGKTSARPRAVPASSYEEPVVFPKRSNKGFLIVAGVATVVVIGGLLMLRGGSSTADTTSAPTTAAATQQRAPEEPRIPPPPPVAETAPAPPPVTAAPAPHTAEPPPAAPAPPAPLHVAAPTHVPDPPHAPRNPSPQPKASTKPSSGGIVRDNPF